MDPRKVFLIELHEIIKNSSEIRNHLVDASEDNIISDMFKLSIEEVNALKKYNFDDVVLSAIEKSVRDNIERAFFRALALLDAVGDPEVVEIDKTWLGLTLHERKLDEEEDNEEFLHDEFYEVYWDWLERRNKDKC